MKPAYVRLSFRSFVSVILFLNLAVAQSGSPPQLSPERYVQQAVWIPYWSEQSNAHAVLHLRNALHHSDLQATMDVFSSAGAALVSVPVFLPRVSNADFPLASLIPDGSPAGSRSGSIRITYKYPYDAALQAELSMTDGSRGWTIVGRSSHVGTEKTAYLAVQVPTPDTYLEVAFANPTGSPVNILLTASQASGWKTIGSVSLSPNSNQKVRVSETLLNDPNVLSSTRVALLKAEYSVTSTEIVSNAWLTDDTTGFSNTALLHDDYVHTNTLFATELVIESFPKEVLPNGPRFDSWLVFVNVNDAPVDLKGTLFCDSGSGPVSTQVPALHLLPYSPQTIRLEDLVFPDNVQPRPAMCSGKFQYSGAPGHVIGRFYGVSQSKAYGIYVKLEPFVTRGYNEVYWSIDGDFVPLVTVTNFSDDSDNLSIYVSSAGALQQLAQEKVPGHGSFTFNMRDQVAALRTKSAFTATIGGFYIASEKPDGRVMVKQQAFSAQKLMMVPYYGTPDYIMDYYFSPACSGSSCPAGPPNPMYPGDQQTEVEMICFYSSGCFWDLYPLSSSDDTVASVSLFTVTAQAAGQATITAPPECCDQGGYDFVPPPMDFTVQTKCFAQLRYRPVDFVGIPTNFNHSFWWMQNSIGTRYVTEGGPSGNCVPDCGYLFAWLAMGDTGHYTQDSPNNPNATIAWYSGLSQMVCDGVTKLYTYALGWSPTQYSYVLGGAPNSNTYAHWAGNAAGFSPTPPPNSPGW